MRQTSRTSNPRLSVARSPPPCRHAPTKVARRCGVSRASGSWQGLKLGDRLRELVGPLVPASDPPVKSRAAFAFAIAHLADVDEAASR